MFYVIFITKHLFSLELEISLSIDIIMHKQNEARTPVKTNIDALRSIYVEWLCYIDKVLNLFIVPNSVIISRLFLWENLAPVLEQVSTLIKLACFVCFY